MMVCVSFDHSLPNLSLIFNVAAVVDLCYNGIYQLACEIWIGFSIEYDLH